MANPFVAGEDSDPTAGLPNADTFSNLKDQWNTFLGRPEGRAALLSFGINMLQPQFGQNLGSKIGESIGAAGATVGNIERMDIAQKEAQSKEALRGAQADVAGARAGQAGLAAQLGLERTQNALTASQMMAKNNLHAHYLAHIDRINKANENNALMGQPLIKVPTPQEFIATDPIAQSIAAQAGIPTTGAALPPIPPTPGEIKNGYRFKGGDPGNKDNWEPVSGR